MFEEIYNHIQRGFDECIITYTPDCPDGTVRNVELHYTDYCNGKTETVVRQATYTAPLDSSKFAPVEYVLHKTTVRGGETATLPLELISAIPPQSKFYPAAVRVMFDTSCVSFNGFTGSGPLANAPVTVKSIPGGIELQIEDAYTLDMPGILGSLSFIASDPYDTTTCIMRLESWVAEAGCYIPVLNDGEITILPKLPVITGGVILPESLVCTNDSNVYNPNPFTARFYVVNNGEKEALNVKYKLLYNTADMELVSPLTDTQAGTPPVALIGAGSAAEWQLRALPRITGDSVEIFAIASFYNHPDVTIAGKIWIPPTCPALECTLDAAQRAGSPVIDATVSVSNRGGETTDTTYASIILPSPLKLFGPDAPDKYTKVLAPEQIVYNMSSVASWQVDCLLAENRDYTIGVWTWSANADSVYCETIVSVELPVAACTITAPSALMVEANAYTPNPFDLDYTLTNTGNAQLDVADISIQLPAYITTTDPLTKTVAPLAPSGKHDITWPLTALTSAYEREAVITVVAMDAEGNMLSSCEHRVFLPGVDGLECNAGEEIVLVNDLNTNGYVPNPINKSVTVHNGLDSALTNVEIEASVSSAEIAITMPVPPVNAISQIPAGQDWITNWTLEVPNLLDKQTTATITYRIRSDQYPAWRECSFDVIIPPRQYTYCADCLADGIDTVWINQTNEIMVPVPFQAYVAVANNCTGALTDVRCNIDVPSRLSLAAGETLVKTILRIEAGDTTYVSWDLAAAPAVADESVTVQVSIIANELSAPSTCVHTVHLVHTSDIPLAVSKKLLYFQAIRNAALPQAQEVTVYAGFPTEMPWIAQHPSWLDVAPSNSTTAETQTVQPNTTAFPLGRYWGDISYSSSQPNAPKTVNVVYDITDGTVGISQPPSSAHGITLHQNYPNPFASSTTISYTTEIPQPITVTVYNTLGVPVRVVRQDAVTGNNTIQLSGMPSGMYMVVVRGRDGVASRRMVAR